MQPRSLVPPGTKPFFEAFGYAVLRGWLADEIDWITEEFEATFAQLGVVHDGASRSSIIPFIDHRPRLRALIEHPRVDSLFSTLLGDDWNYFSSDANYYTGDTPWHPDGTRRSLRFVKLAVYLDPVTAHSGALRVIPGSHHVGAEGKPGFGDLARRAPEADSVWGITAREVPAVALDSEPGDVVVFDQNLLHGSWGGNEARRMFTMNATERATTEAGFTELREIVEGHSRFWMDAMYDDALLAEATPRVRRRVAQVLASQGRLAELTAQARLEMDGPANRSPARRAPKAPSTRVSGFAL